MLAHTVRSVATSLNLLPTINRAISFQPTLARLERVIWDTPITYPTQMGTSAGWFRANPCRISLHPALEGTRAQPQDHIETFLHELAHEHQFLVYGIVDHGATWWEMMYQLGQQPRRTHKIAACKPLSHMAALTPDEMGL